MKNTRRAARRARLSPVRILRTNFPSRSVPLALVFVVASAPPSLDVDETPFSPVLNAIAIRSVLASPPSPSPDPSCSFVFPRRFVSSKGITPWSIHEGKSTEATRSRRRRGPRAPPFLADSLPRRIRAPRAQTQHEAPGEGRVRGEHRLFGTLFSTLFGILFGTSAGGFGDGDVVDAGPSPPACVASSVRVAGAADVDPRGGDLGRLGSSLPLRLSDDASDEPLEVRELGISSRRRAKRFGVE